MAKIAHINYDKCISCGSCSDLDTICPVGLQVQQITHPTTYVITNNTGEWQNSYVIVAPIVHPLIVVQVHSH